jgi:hypothetical protein
VSETTFKHLVSKSTLTQGIAVRRDYEAWFGAPGKGDAREIALRYGSGEVQVTLRRLNNESGSVQIRYESKRQGAFRDWLMSTFGSLDAGVAPQVLEFEKEQPDVYRVVPIVGHRLEKLHLCLGPALYHNNADNLAEANPVFPDIPSVICSIGYGTDHGQMYYNEQIRKGFVERGWQADEVVIPGLPLRSDFKRDDVQVEVEFGNARSYYQDYLKFLLPFTRGMIRIGVLLVPTADFARLLCLAGTRRAMKKIGAQGPTDRVPKYSGMITYEKVEREFESLRFILNMPLAVRGIDFWGSP